MCVVSMVFDHYNPFFPPIIPLTPYSPVPGGIPYPAPIPGSTLTSEQWFELIKTFREAVEAAKFVDRVTNQPDCEDPEKAKLEIRVAELERRLLELEGTKKAKKAKKSRSKNPRL